MFVLRYNNSIGLDSKQQRDSSVKCFLSFFFYKFFIKEIQIGVSSQKCILFLTFYLLHIEFVDIQLLFQWEKEASEVDKDDVVELNDTVYKCVVCISIRACANFDESTNNNSLLFVFRIEHLLESIKQIVTQNCRYGCLMIQIAQNTNRFSWSERKKLVKQIKSVRR